MEASGISSGSDLLSHGNSHTIIGAEQFHFRVRDGVGWDPLAMAARQFFTDALGWTCRTHPKSWVLYGQASRAISTGQLHTLPCFHIPPINVVVYDNPLGTSRSREISSWGRLPA